jgi:tryptophan halogenase
MEIPAALEDKIAQFRNKARIFAEGVELFPRQSWIAVMLGQNIVPAEYEPVVDGLDENKVAQALEHLRRVIQDTANTLPPHGEFVRQCCDQSNSAIPTKEFVL